MSPASGHFEIFPYRLLVKIIARFCSRP